jgi:hypothetical protein
VHYIVAKVKVNPKVKAKASLYLINKYHAININFGSRWRSVVSFTTRPLSSEEGTPLPIGEEA